MHRARRLWQTVERGDIVERGVAGGIVKVKEDVVWIPAPKHLTVVDMLAETGLGVGDIDLILVRDEDGRRAQVVLL